ncbi:hypothetical protein KSP39_PZI013696 [Platanthera zijinensis]|uniref:DUF659 domain-containing protein n=1 Tax=Platanthera zijinensis TaxID=2320716 RepID=A0AAP0G4A0_9ASPA
MKFHLSRLPSKGVHPCSKVRDDVTDRVKSIIAMKEEEKEASNAKKQRLDDAKPPGIVSSPKPPVSAETAAAKLFPCPATAVRPTASPLDAERCIAEFFFENKLDFSVARSSSYQLMLEALGGPGFGGPTVDALKTAWLPKLKSEVSSQVIMDNSLNYACVGNHILQSYGSIFWSPCASHCLNLILDDFSRIDWVNRCILRAQTVTRFVYNNARVLELMMKFTGGQELVRSGITRPTSSFLTLQSLLRQRSRLKHMFNSPEYSTFSYSNRSPSLSCIDIVEDIEFWRGVEEIASVSEPLLKRRGCSLPI